MTVFFERINPTKIILNHFSTLYDATNERPDIVEIALVALGPWLLAAAMTLYWEVEVEKDLAQTLFAAFAITGGFLINALMVLADKYQKTTQEAPNEDRESLLRETFYNTSFGVLVCIVAVVLCAAFPFTNEGVTRNLLTFFIFVLSFSFLHTLLMVIKRLNKIFEI